MEEIRFATMDDLAVCADLLGQLFSQEREFAPDPSTQRRGLEMIVTSPETGSVFVYEADGVIKGMVILLYTVSTALGKRVAILEDLILSPDVRGRGAAIRLIEHVMDFAARQGLGRITLLTDYDNETAHRFYGKFGFKKSDMVVFRHIPT